MKKLASLLVLALASTVLVACGSSNDNESTTTNTTTTTNSAGGEAASGATATGGAAAAGGGKANSGSGGASVLKFEADPGGGLAYTATTASTSAGEVTVEFNNPQALTHDVAIEDSAGKEVGKTDLVADGSAATTVALKPGTYTFFCTVPGHREAGMEGTLTVK